MSKVRITKQFEFEGAHALLGYDGKCRHIHGHSYKLFVTVIGSPSVNTEEPKTGMVMDFSELKDIVKNHVINPFDHALMLREDSPLIKELERDYCNVVIMGFQPTCENLVIHIANILKREMRAGTELFSIKLHETATSFAEWFAADNIKD